MAEDISKCQHDKLFPSLVYVRFQKTITIPGSNYLEITREDMGWFVPTGYRPLGLVGVEIASDNVILSGVNPFHNPAANSTMIWLRNRQSSAYSDAIVAVTYAFTNIIMPWSTSENNVYYNVQKFGKIDTTKWSDWERDLPEGAGVLLTIENAGPVTNE